VNEPVRATLLLFTPSREEVFAEISAIERFPEWAIGLKEARLLDTTADGLAPGAAIRFTLSAAGLTHRVTGTVIAVEPPRLLQWRYTKGAVGTGGWTLEEAPGAVRMTLHTSYEVTPSWLDRLANRPFFRGITEDLLRRSMRRLGERLERG
jgi:uncharacterized protein YndB with AHSA1/START domain